jgi:hypothetical protein
MEHWETLGGGARDSPPLTPGAKLLMIPKTLEPGVLGSVCVSRTELCTTACICLCRALTRAFFCLLNTGGGGEISVTAHWLERYRPRTHLKYILWILISSFNG